MNFFESLLFTVRNKVRVQKGNYVSIGSGSKVKKCKIIIKGRNNKLIIGQNLRVNNVFFEIIGDNCIIQIGDRCLIGENSYLSAREKSTTIKIGNDCGLSRNVKVMTSDGHDIFRDEVRVNPARSIYLDNKVWIADNVTILKGVKIGENSIVGINSTVTKDVGNNQIAVGCPAKMVADNVCWSSTLTY